MSKNQNPSKCKPFFKPCILCRICIGKTFLSHICHFWVRCLNGYTFLPCTLGPSPACAWFFIATKNELRRGVGNRTSTNSTQNARFKKRFSFWRVLILVNFLCLPSTYPKLKSEQSACSQQSAFSLDTKSMIKNGNLIKQEWEFLLFFKREEILIKKQNDCLNLDHSILT